ncbi:hypothetical protein EIP91_003766 [Steccherinum ochraceum]|uniref:Protein kinase domain-containing protein n=1 Tax=Steccherinum ochraceum TaxID=92696 RepID=A0A4R0RBD3_9APHY|nr:hypothetical protein EIP91_003766 [Steccherinum ochraceum]
MSRRQTDSRRSKEIDKLLYDAVPVDVRTQTEVSHIPPSHAQDTIDAAWEKLDNPMPLIHRRSNPLTEAVLLRRLCLKISVQYHVLPSTFYITGVVALSMEPIDSGAFADIYEGQYKGFNVIIKRPRITEETYEKRYKVKLEFCRESMLWSKLNHKHVLPLLGICQEVFPRSVCMVLPKMENGNIRRRLASKDPEKMLTVANYERYVNRWLYEIALGLAYLHDQGVVHGDLHGGNILIDDTDSVRLTDFGFALIAAATPNSYGSKHGGSAHHFMAPELWEPSDFGMDQPRPTTACDVYAFGCTAIELYTGEKPFSEHKMTLYRISKRVLRGERPSQPSTPFGVKMDDRIWELVSMAWSHQPGHRLSAAQAAQGMEPYVVR